MTYGTRWLAICDSCRHVRQFLTENDRDTWETARVHPSSPGPTEVNAALNRLLIGDALAQLSAEQRAVIRRSYYLGWTTTQIAEDLQIAQGTVKSALHYAVRGLRLTPQEMGVTR
jgi:RNA polymerase sigma factor (sigma-70 family)